MARRIQHFDCLPEWADVLYDWYCLTQGEVLPAKRFFRFLDKFLVIEMVEDDVDMDDLPF